MDCQRSARGSSMIRSISWVIRSRSAEVVVDLGDRPAASLPVRSAIATMSSVGKAEEKPATRAASSSGTPARGQLVVDPLVPLQIRAAQQLGQLGQTCSTPLGEEVDGLGELQRLRPVAEQPAGAALDQPPRVQPDPGLDVGRDLVVQRLDRVPHLARARRSRGPRSAPARSPRSRRPVSSRSRCRKVVPPRVDRVVDQHRRDDLAAQRVAVDLLGEPLAQRRAGSRRAAARCRYGSSGSVGGDQLVRDRDLGVGEQHGQLGLVRPAPGVEALADLPVGRAGTPAPGPAAPPAPGGA